MLKAKQVGGFAIAASLLLAGCAESTEPLANHVSEAMMAGQILDKVAATYASMEAYEAQGSITSDIDSGGTKMTLETSFSILLKKPNLYLITWTQNNMPMAGMAQSGAVWSDGTQPYLYMGMMKAYSKMGSDELALASATGISGGAAFTIPSLFLSLFKEQPAPFSRLIDPKIERSEKVGEDECYVIGSSSPISKKEVLWVSKTNFLLKKYYRSLERPEGGGEAVSELTDEQLEETIKGMGKEVTDESKQKMKEMMEKSKEALKTASIKGSSTELHTDISTSHATAKDFQFTPPKDSVLKDSLFGEVLGEGN